MAEPYTIDANGCWLWSGCILKSSYSQVSRDGVREYAHRWMYKRHKGEIPEGLDLDHLCRIRHCVNPDHLEPVTRTENAQRGQKARVNKDVVREIREEYAKGFTQKQIAKLHGVSQPAISKIVRNETWIDNQLKENQCHYSQL